MTTKLVERCCPLDAGTQGSSVSPPGEWRETPWWKAVAKLANERSNLAAIGKLSAHWPDLCHHDMRA